MKINSVLFTENSISNINYIIGLHELNTEIGGSLVGYQHNDQLVITHVSDPGINAKMSYDSITIDGEYVTDFCNRLNKLSQNRLYFLGDWHTHLSNNLNPSNRDLEAMKLLTSYTPDEYRDSLVTVIIDHYNPVYMKVYILGGNKKLKQVSHQTVPNPLWVAKLI